MGKFNPSDRSLEKAYEKQHTLDLARHAVKVLNRALKKDPDAISKLVSYRVVCNDLLADDSTIQVANGTMNGQSMTAVGLLGIVNGIVGKSESGWGYVAAVFELECPDHGAESPMFKGLGEGDTCPLFTRLMTLDMTLRAVPCEHKLRCGRITKFQVLKVRAKRPL